ncbi:predicted protein [Naegleria gruberi]|uniref:Predicted protein n=1 Tax=Naegleria gruberi TaxID=5762 RepID=D2V260_NAEGR|nr:uncharacterized protein NAEGRDRAFT_46085 [Naegleria gruberi]EFC48996.1 predicted protein [Naegleria gruberi]|eukprot:XP_002681740.1 predicted protein [Naegleria gruberi strain NEG-M]
MMNRRALSVVASALVNKSSRSRMGAAATSLFSSSSSSSFNNTTPAATFGCLSVPSTRYYSRKSHMKTAMYLETYLHEAFISSIDELAVSVNGKDAHTINWHEFHAKFEALKASLKAQSKLEDLGWVPAIHEFISTSGKEHKDLQLLSDLKSSHILEHQAINHIEHIIKHHQHHQGPTHNKMDELKNHLAELRKVVEDHFQTKENIVVPLSEQVLSKEDLRSIQEQAFAKLLETDQNAHQVLHYYSFSKNSLDLTEAMVREVLAARSENKTKADAILTEFKKHMPQEVWLQVVERIPEVKSL